MKWWWNNKLVEWWNLDLGEDGDTLQVDGEGPEDLHEGELVVEQQPQEEGRAKQELHPGITHFHSCKIVRSRYTA